MYLSFCESITVVMRKRTKKTKLKYKFPVSKEHSKHLRKVTTMLLKCF